jgi:hypothetical protein
MKKLFITLLVVPLLFSSCNKKLKEEVKELDSQVSDLKSKNDALHNQINGLSSILGSNEPITATTSFVDDNGVTRTWTDTYSFKSSGPQGQLMEDNGDGTYDIFINRFKDVNGNEGAWVYFTYNPTTGVITNKGGGQYWEWNLPYGDQAGYIESYGNCTADITLSNMNATTGEISLSFSGTSNSAYYTNYPYYSPNDTGASTSFSFTGTLSIYPEN